MVSSAEYHIVADGFSQLVVDSYNPNLPELTSEQGADLERFVRQQMASHAQRGGNFYDGDMVGVVVDSIRAAGPALHMRLQAMKYSHHARLFRENPAASIQAMYVNALVLTADERLVTGITQFTEAQFMDKLGIPAGGLKLGPEGVPSFGVQIYDELGGEIGFIPSYHLAGEVELGWINAGSERERNYHMTTSFVVPHRLTSDELAEYFTDWKAAQDKMFVRLQERTGKEGKTEFVDLRFVPNDPAYVKRFVEEGDEEAGVQVLGKTADVLEEWATRYHCDIERLRDAKSSGTQIHLPQRALF